jgi:hypothetical protein
MSSLGVKSLRSSTLTVTFSALNCSSVSARLSKMKVRSQVALSVAYLVSVWRRCWLCGPTDTTQMPSLTVVASLPMRLRASCTCTRST